MLLEVGEIGECAGTEVLLKSSIVELASVL